MIIEDKESKGITFQAVAQPGAAYAFVPDDLHIIVPKAPRIAIADRHYLAYLPWEARYLQQVPVEHQRFFMFVLPFLHARTSNVHTALSINQIPYLVRESISDSDMRLIYLALILHDTGWSQVGQQGLVDSLSYNGVSPSSTASFKPKQQHLIYGESLAYTLLDAFDFADQPPLSSEEIYAICEMIRRHDHDAAWEQGKYGHISEAIRIVCDADRLWSYTHENFWLDTVRKAVPPEAYLQGINAEIDNYFFTKAGRTRARQLISERQLEVAAHSQLIQDPEQRTALIWQSRNPTRRLIYRTQQVAHKIKSRRMHRLITRQNAY